MHELTEKLKEAIECDRPHWDWVIRAWLEEKAKELKDELTFKNNDYVVDKILGLESEPSCQVCNEQLTPNILLRNLKNQIVCERCFNTPNYSDTKIWQDEIKVSKENQSMPDGLMTDKTEAIYKHKQYGYCAKHKTVHTIDEGCNPEKSSETKNECSEEHLHWVTANWDYCARCGCSLTNLAKKSLEEKVAEAIKKMDESFADSNAKASYQMMARAAINAMEKQNG